MKAINRTVQGYQDRSISYTHVFNQDATRKLAIFMPGIGYTAKSPLFHYTESLLLEQEYDVLRINYDYRNPFYDHFTIKEMEDAVTLDVNCVINQALKSSNYEKFFLAGKSLGTVALASELERPVFKEAKVVWLTPLIKHPKVFQTMKQSKNDAISFIGDKDQYFDRLLLQELQENERLDAHVLSNINHGMDYPGSPLKSIDSLKEVITDIERFSKTSNQHT